MLLSKDNTEYALHLPFTLFPSPYSSKHFTQVADLQPYINLLVYKIANSHAILEKIFSK